MQMANAFGGAAGFGEAFKRYIERADVATAMRSMNAMKRFQMLCAHRYADEKPDRLSDDELEAALKVGVLDLLQSESEAVDDLLRTHGSWLSGHASLIDGKSGGGGMTEIGWAMIPPEFAEPVKSA